MGPFLLMLLTVWVAWENNWAIDPPVIILAFVTLIVAAFSATAVDAETKKAINAMRTREMPAVRRPEGQLMLGEPGALPDDQEYKPGNIFKKKM